MGPEHRSFTLTDEGGVPVVGRPRPGSIVEAGLMFAVGEAHEPPRLRGITHLLEHLAHDGLGQVDYDFNASVTATRTTFWARGTAEEVRGHLAHVVRRLSEPPVAAMEREAGVLRAEGGGGGPPVLVDRFTPQGFGGLRWRDFFLDDPDAERLVSWAAERFGRHGLVGYVLGPPMELGVAGLGDGRPTDGPRADPRPGFPLPAVGVGPDGHVAWSGACARGWAGGHAMSILEARCRQRLRDELGASYAVDTGVEADGERRYRWLHADHDHAGDPRAVRDVLLQELDRLAVEEPSADEVARPARRLRRSMDDPDNDDGLVHWLARTLQDEGRWATPEERLAELEAVRPAEVSAAARELRGSMLLQVPAGCEPPPGTLTPHRAPDDVARDAPVFVPSRVRRGLVEPGRELRMAPEHGAVQVHENGAALSMPWSDVVLFVVEDDIATWLYDLRGQEIHVELDDDEDRARWLAPALRALGPDRIARRDTGRRALRAAVEARAQADLSDPERHARGTLGLESVVGRHERVQRLAAARDDGDDVLLAVTDVRFIVGRIDRIDGAWWPLAAVEPREVREGLRGGRLEVVTEGGGTVAFDRIRPRGRAGELADLLRVDAAPAP